ncbi:MAG: cupin domain-containing protein [Planctomycetota bacterium]|jgi:mannose-6-phosphate isomerase-like protein (cupin superfamily)
MPEKVNLADAFRRFSDHWSPRIAGEVNDMYVKLAKLEGEFVWHQHETEDELFLVVKGNLEIRLRDGTVHLGPGEFFVVPHGTEHLPVAEEECHVLLLERKSTLNTGDVEDARTRRDLERL